jgi:hypothetical protein
MSLNFPASPSPNQIYEGFFWDVTASIWRRLNAPALVFNVQTGTSYTVQLSDQNKIIELNNENLITLTVPEDSINFPIGSSVNLVQTGLGSVVIEGASGVTINATPGLKLREQWSSATIIKRASNLWLAVGDLIEIE